MTIGSVQFAGRIENAAELRAKYGIATAGGDADLVAALLDRAGAAAVGEIEGGFAFIARRSGQAEVLVARDQLARQPLYWRQEAGEVRASLGLEDLTGSGAAEADRAAVLEWLLYRQVLPPATLYRGVRALPAGACLELPTDDEPAPSFPALAGKYFSPELMRELAGIGDAAIIDEVDRLVMAGVEAACAGCSHVGVLLSGGMDSTLLATLACRLTRVTALTMATAGQELDESGHARRTAARLGMAIEVIAVDPAAYARQAPGVTRRLGLPLFHANNIGFNVAFDGLLARAAGLGIDRVLTGDMAATPFGFSADWAMGPGWQRPLRRLLGRTPRSVAPFLQKAALDVAGLPIAAPEMAMGVPLALQLIDGGARSRLLAAALDACAPIRDDRDRMIKAVALTNIEILLPRFSERAALLGNRHGVEVAVPYYDSRLMRFGFAAPARVAYRRQWPPARRWASKWPFKEVLQRHSPDVGFFRRGKAWSLPQARFAGPLAAALLTPDGFCAGLFQLGPAALRDEVARWRQDADSLSKLVHLELWGRVCLMGQDADELGERLATATAAG